MKTSTYIDRSKSYLFWTLLCWIAIVIPQTPNFIKLTLGVSSVALMSKSGSLLDKAKDNPQRRIYEASMKS